MGSMAKSMLDEDCSMGLDHVELLGNKLFNCRDNQIL